MHYSNEKTRELINRYHEISTLGKVNALLSWDLNVNLPEKASEDRANQIAQLTAIISDKWLDTQFRTLLEAVSADTHKLTPEEKAMIRNLNWSGKFYFRVPKAIIVEFSKATSEAFMVWQRARRESDFAAFAPYLERNIKLNQTIAEHLGYKDNPYDALLDLYEQGLTTAMCQKIFSYLTKELKVLISDIKAKKQIGGTQELIGPHQFYSQKRQRDLALFILKRMGYDFQSGRMDISPHPFTQFMGLSDVRITTRYNLNDFRDSLTAAIHEGGHALYEQGVYEDYENTPLAGGVSLGIHESQSRFWENQVGRSSAFLTWFAPTIQAFFQEQLGDTKTEDIIRLFNTVKPNLIRIESDEVTYNLHIALRFDLENKLINGKIKPKDLPELWKVNMKKLLGIVPETDADGVLQDVHWSYGNFGYFPTYTLGNLYAAQFTKKMQTEIDLENKLISGDLGTILSWMRENIHRHGSLYWPNELVKKVTGEPLNPKYLVGYLKKKYTAIYGIK